jgi:hypothetical protein
MRKFLLVASISLILASLISSCKRDDSLPPPINCDGLITDTAGTNDDGRIFFASAFSPNGDGVNDIARPILSGISTVNFTVYDLSNNVVFTSSQAGSGFTPAVSPNSYVKFYYKIQATTTANHKIGTCGEFHVVNCLPANVSKSDYSFEDQLRFNGFTGVTAENPQRCN